MLVPNAGGWHGQRPFIGSADEQRVCVVTEPDEFQRVWNLVHGVTDGPIKVALRRFSTLGDDSASKTRSSIVR